MLGGEEWTTGDAKDAPQGRDEERHERKRQESERLRLEQEYTRLLSAYEISPEEEDAFRVVVTRVPDHYDDWSADTFELAIKVLDSKGRGFYRKCLRKVEGFEAQNGGDDDGEGESAPPPPEEEEHEPAPPADESPGQAEDEDRPPPPGEVKKRKTLISSIQGTTHLLGEDETLAQEWAGKMFGEEPGTMIRLEELSVEELIKVDRALTEELKQGGQP